eukprot:GFYU01000752.1.p1 GENE.GFYU01000752.1~~GFYU01000752.1.p1  ORF type:complete len:120 (+),score=31.92 GFYU01000752.1:65-424(+)
MSAFDGLLEELAQYLFSESTFEEFENFATEHCGVFEDGEENKLEYTEVYNHFLGLYEDKLGAFLQEKNLSAEDFADLLREHRDEHGHEDSNIMIEMLLAFTDFEAFLATMKDKAREMRG